MENRIKILAISHSFLRKINTEMFLVLKNKYNYKIELICPKFHKDSNKKIYPDFTRDEVDINIIFEKTIFNHLRFKLYKNLIKIIKKKKINYIFLDIDIISLQSLILIICSFLFNYKICYFSNENNIIEEKSNLKKLVKIFSFKIINFLFKSKIFKIFCYTEQIKKNLDYCGLKNKTMIIPLGFDTKKFNRTFRSENHKKFTISYFGKIEPKKGVHTLLKALNLLKFDNWIFTLDVFDIYSVDYFRSLKPDLIKLINKKKLKLIKCNHNNINQFMKQSDLTVVPSEWNEQYGRVIQESAASGSIVIGSNVGAIPEILIDNEFIFEPNNPYLLKQKIEYIYFNFDNLRSKFNNIERLINLNRSIDKQSKLISEILS